MMFSLTPPAHPAMVETSADPDPAYGLDLPSYNPLLD
jgi:hypothetical protein